ncbi:hypothetical protein BDV93DRAFT_45532 [Ceratobasidium sp. AG-I]|nr:hypothetical protein BDV93DRAFT_45532 [Ceratobasidium sp. AG-I]
MSSYAASEKYGIPEMYLDAQEGVKSYQIHLPSTQLPSPRRLAPRQRSLTSKTVRYFRGAWTAITRIGATSKPHSYTPQNFNSIHSPVEAYDEKHPFCPNHLSTPVGKYIPVTVDGLVIGHVTFPDALAPNIVGAALSEDSKSLALATETPPAPTFHLYLQFQLRNPTRRTSSVQHLMKRQSDSRAHFSHTESLSLYGPLRAPKQLVRKLHVRPSKQYTVKSASRQEGSSNFHQCTIRKTCICSGTRTFSDEGAVAHSVVGRPA